MHGCARHICVVTIADRQSPERKKFWMHEIRLNIKKRNLAFLSAMIMIITDRGTIRLRLQQGIYHKVPKMSGGGKNESFHHVDGKGAAGAGKGKKLCER